MDLFKKCWSSAVPGLVIILVDQSYSTKAYAVEVSEIVNKIVYEFIANHIDGDTVRNVIYLNIITNYDNQISVLYEGLLSKVADNYLRLEKTTKSVNDGTGKMISIESEEAIWIQPNYKGNLSVIKGYNLAYDLTRKWLKKFPNRPIPIIINVSKELSLDIFSTQLYNGMFKIEELENNLAEKPLIINVQSKNDIDRIKFIIELTHPEVQAYNNELFLKKMGEWK